MFGLFGLKKQTDDIHRCTLHFRPRTRTQLLGVSATCSWALNLLGIGIALLSLGTSMFIK